VTPHSGPSFLDFPLDYVFMEAEAPTAIEPLPQPWLEAGADGTEPARAAELLRAAQRPVIMAGTNLYWGRGEEQLLSLAEQLRVPVFLNGLGRGCVPADHELFFSRARSAGLGEADVALVIGVPLDFRLGFGASFSPAAKIVGIDQAAPERTSQRELAAGLYGALPATLDQLRATASGARNPAREHWIAGLRRIED